MLYTSAIPGITQIHATADDPSKNSHVHYVGDTREKIVHTSHIMENGKFPLHPGHTPCPVDHETHIQLPHKGITDERLKVVFTHHYADGEDNLVNAEKPRPAVPCRLTTHGPRKDMLGTSNNIFYHSDHSDAIAGSGRIRGRAAHTKETVHDTAYHLGFGR